MKNPFRFYVYEHWRPDKDVCFYVGKGMGRRANDMACRNPHHKNIQKKLARLGMCVEVRMVLEGLSEDEAFYEEAVRVGFWRDIGVPLANLTDGGGGVSGWRPNEEQRRKLGDAHRGKKRSPEACKKTGDAHRGKIVSEESRRRMSEGQKRSRSEADRQEWARQGGLAQKGIKRSPETRARMAESARRSHALNPRGPEVREKIGAAQRGVNRGPRKPHSAETRAKMSISAKRWRLERKEARELSGERE